MEKLKQQPIFDLKTIREYDASPFKQIILMQHAFPSSPPPHTHCSKLHNWDSVFCFHNRISIL